MDVSLPVLSEDAQAAVFLLLTDEEAINQAGSEVGTVTPEEHELPASEESLLVQVAETRASDFVAIEAKKSSTVHKVVVVSCFNCSRGALKALMIKGFGKSRTDQ